jgi:geranylgeranyl diphosphate synthase type II
MDNIMDHKEIYSEYLSKVEKKIAETVHLDEPRQLYEPFKYIMTGGGKRIRPVLTMISAAALGADPSSALNSGVAIEILHNFTLVHDDIMDQSPMRRGKKTVHIKWDEPVAILLGDVMVGWAYSLLPSSSQHPRADQIREAFTKGLIEVCEGQAYDMQYNEKKDITLVDYFTMIEKKTAKLLETCGVIGAHIAEGSDEEVEIIRKFCYNMGIGFQIQDDLLDVVADQSKLGKKIGLDIIEGKKTFLILSLKNLAKSPDALILLEEFFVNNGLPENKINTMSAMMRDHGVFDLAREKSHNFFDAARNELHKLHNKETGMLLWLLETISSRSY